MTIEVANPLDGIVDSPLDEDIFTEEGESYNLRQLIDMIYEQRDLIFTVPTSDVEILKKGLITRKAKDNVKLKDASIARMQEVLSFVVYPKKDEDGQEIPGQSCVRVKLGPKKSVTILKVEKPSDDF